MTHVKMYKIPTSLLKSCVVACETEAIVLKPIASTGQASKLPCSKLPHWLSF